MPTSTSRPNIKLDLTDHERRQLRRHKVKIADLTAYAVDELELMLQVPTHRARELFALADFQRIPTVGIEFARDLIFMGYFAVQELRDQDGAELRNEFERQKGYRIDSCVEDQFRLAVHYARTGDTSKRWWDFTPERKRYRAQFGYPEDRPVREWHEFR